MTAASPLGVAALKYAGAGWPVFPLRPNRKEPLVDAWDEVATTDRDQVQAWWRREPRANIGCIPGRTGHLVIDIDGPAGEIVAQRLGLLAEPTLEVVTGRDDGGRHRWFAHPGGHIGNTELAPKLDVRADAGYVVLPPSVHPTGRVYRWAGLLADVIPLPPPMIERLTAKWSPARGPAAPIDERIVEGQRNQILTRLAGALRRVGAGPAMLRTALESLNAHHVDPPLPPPDLDLIVRSITRYPPADPTAIAQRAEQATDRRTRYAT